MRKATLVAWLLFLAGVGLVVWYYFATVPGSDPAVVNDAPGQAGGPQIEITVAGEANGKVLIELFDNLAPQHAERITRLADEGAYDGVVFHRVIDGFMAQTGDVAFGLEGGDMSRAGIGGSDYPDLPAEFSNEPFVRGVVGMARSSNPDSGNSQFFIMFDEAPFLDGEYTVVGRVIEGMDVVMDIKRGEGPNGAVIGQPDVMTNVDVVK
ncbi:MULTISPECIES: peptidylprolyl isomerase [Maritimibacter]|jgi:peptidylprolyl isomerase|uniref:Peptidyl-prolyl cis-trans isomerase n=1 Tax=Maritimibacter alkaliphilus HTCC2654 TaxID=314271 RepID=A3VKZ9_9RHOB|nr:MULTISPECIES: peptidylprolyl isomerase [Maritimibacter]EAQ11049.1 peptidyl-prolyl cis-trans isomerase, cyclophilin-type [Rhodobacterales bacterium HTCC2654] [Maritimibacter alkaliphilus HTCC2654]MBL6429368.1 peptidylprolyl isomerase [Maritimibacter sp.]TYP81608.1 peptidylprolyl isomerase [Maritimibacter alkaliphilus HTCC2654]